MVKDKRIVLQASATYLELSEVTGIDSPTHLNNMVWNLCAPQLIQHLRSFDPMAIASINQATQE
jgi:hypothetical protein